MKKTLLLTLALGTTALLSACCCPCHSGKKCDLSPEGYTLSNQAYYKDGKFDDAAAKDAYFTMMKHFNYPIYPQLKTKEFWVTDFGVGDFAQVGMGGIFWMNEIYPNVPGSKYEGTGFLGHEIYLLPGQMIVEHAHMATKKAPAKREGWLVRHGSCYSFSIQDGKNPIKNMPEFLAKSQVEKNFITCNTFKELKEGDVDILNKEGYKHFLIAGPEGAIITETGNFHDNDGLRFTNDKASL